MKVGGWEIPRPNLRAISDKQDGLYISKDDLAMWLTECAEAADKEGAAEAVVIRQLRDHLRKLVPID